MVNTSTSQKCTRNTKWLLQVQGAQSCLAFGARNRGHQGRNEVFSKENSTHEFATLNVVWGHSLNKAAYIRRP